MPIHMPTHMSIHMSIHMSTRYGQLRIRGFMPQAGGLIVGVMLGGSITFQWADSFVDHDVWQFRLLRDWESCDFSGATLLGATSPVRFEVHDTFAPDLLFASRPNQQCAAGLKVTVVVSCQEP